MGFHHVDQAGLELLTSGDPPKNFFMSATVFVPTHGIEKGFIAKELVSHRENAPFPTSSQAVNP